jgi:VCBS repeat-containing protein
VLSGTYGTLNINQAGAWTYNLDNSRIATQHLAEGQTETETFAIEVMDEHGASDTETVTISVTGSNGGPVMHTAAVSRPDRDRDCAVYRCRSRRYAYHQLEPPIGGAFDRRRTASRACRPAGRRNDDVAVQRVDR